MICACDKGHVDKGHVKVVKLHKKFVNVEFKRPFSNTVICVLLFAVARPKGTQTKNSKPVWLM